MNTKRLDGKKILVTLTKNLERGIEEYCLDKGIKSQSEFIRAAISKFISNEYSDETLKLTALDELKRQVSELRDMNSIMFKYLNLFHEHLLAYHPELDAGLADSAAASARRRHQKFFESFQNSLAGEAEFFERLLHKYYTEESGG